MQSTVSLQVYRAGFNKLTKVLFLHEYHLQVLRE
jgi:hypothetical protein